MNQYLVHAVYLLTDAQGAVDSSGNIHMLDGSQPPTQAEIDAKIAELEAIENSPATQNARILEQRQARYLKEVDPLRGESEMEKEQGNTAVAVAKMKQAVAIYKQIKLDLPKVAE